MLGLWLLFLHVLSTTTFYIAHGAAAAMVFRIRSESNLDRIRAMLDLSVAPISIYFLSLLILGITGNIMPFRLKLWSKGWVWLSIVLMVIVVVWMFRLSARYKVLRKLVGLPYMEGNKEQPPIEPAGEDVINKHIASLGVNQLVLSGYIIPGIGLWLMIFRPF